MKEILFLCTGNYYRSRFAEELFNFHAPMTCSRWVATSRGIAVDRGHANIGPIAKATVKALQQRWLRFDPESARFPLQLKNSDLEAADYVVALKRSEHFPLIRARFPEWVTVDIKYWRVPDIDELSPDDALPMIEAEVLTLMRQLRSEQD
jgi:protein-tyrosine phosphatase